MGTSKRQKNSIPRRDFLKTSVAAVGALSVPALAEGEGAAPGRGATAEEGKTSHSARAAGRKYNGDYSGEYLSRIAFPLGGIGAGMVCLEGTGALSHVSLRHRPEVFHEPTLFAAICVKRRGKPNVARVLEGPVQEWKKFGMPGAGNGASGASFGLPRFRDAAFRTKFPFASISLKDQAVPLQVVVTGWSPFEPGDADNSSLPVAALEYRFTNPSRSAVDAVFSFNARNFMAVNGGTSEIRELPRGFLLWGGAPRERPWEAGAFCASVTDADVRVNHAWFRGGWFDALTLAWKDVQDGAAYDRPRVTQGGAPPGASLFVPFKLAAGESRTITLQLSWYVGQSNMRIGNDPPRKDDAPSQPAEFYKPWYAGRFAFPEQVARYWSDQYDDLRKKSERFSQCLYDTSLPPEAIEAVAANLTILKSPTVLRQADGKLWAWEGCSDNNGCCHGSCTHVWNYAQALPHLFPDLERTLRETEFGPSQDEKGHQQFRASLPIRVLVHDFHAAADGQLGGIMKVHREWRVSGDTEWLRKLWPRVKTSLDYCIEAWDPSRKGVLEEPHHNTYDIEFWGADGMCTSFYLGALASAVAMGKAVGEDVSHYQALLDKGSRTTETDLYNGEYFIQKIQWTGLRAKNPLETQSMVGDYSPEAVAIFQKEGPKYQYGVGCLSDGVLGSWMAAVCGVGQVLDREKVASHLKAVHKHNLKKDLSDYPNPQRPSYACGDEGGLLLCTWPRGGELSLPFVYSNEVWTGIEYQVASHLIHMGLVDQGLDVVQSCRDRYDGRVRNPFNEYECGHWYARAMSSYALLQALTGARYDAVEKVLHLDPKVPGDFRGFLSTAGGYGTVGVKDGKPFFEVKSGTVDVKEIRFRQAGRT
jgi:uncharacterized protein (DUF608 family)